MPALQNMQRIVPIIAVAIADRRWDHNMQFIVSIIAVATADRRWDHNMQRIVSIITVVTADRCWDRYNPHAIRCFHNCCCHCSSTLRSFHGLIVSIIAVATADRRWDHYMQHIVSIITVATADLRWDHCMAWINTLFPSVLLPPQVDVEIINDSQWEPDEEFYLRMSLLSDASEREGVQMGRISIMEIVILNDDGQLMTKRHLMACWTVRVSWWHAGWSLWLWRLRWWNELAV